MPLLAVDRLATVWLTHNMSLTMRSRARELTKWWALQQYCWAWLYILHIALLNVQPCTIIVPSAVVSGFHSKYGVHSCPNTCANISGFQAVSEGKHTAVSARACCRGEPVCSSVPSHWSTSYWSVSDNTDSLLYSSRCLTLISSIALVANTVAAIDRRKLKKMKAATTARVWCILHNVDVLEKHIKAWNASITLQWLQCYNTMLARALCMKTQQQVNSWQTTA